MKNIFKNYFENRKIHQPSLIIAEASNNHNGDIKLAFKMIEEAHDSGVDIIKFQTFTPNGLYINKLLDAEIEVGDFKGKRRDLIGRNAFSRTEWKRIARHASKVGIPFISTPLDFVSVDLLNEIGVPFFKIASMDVNNYEFLKYIAKKREAVLLSTGMSLLGEVDKGIDVLKKNGAKKVSLMHCVSVYPTPVEKINLSKIQTLRDAFKLNVGFSDHTVGNQAAIGAVAMGVQIFEKHFTLDKKLPGPEHPMCADPKDLKAYVSAIRLQEQAMGNGELRVIKEEEGARNFARRSVIAATQIKKGKIINRKDITCKRPGWGISADLYDLVIGARANKDIQEDDLIGWDDLSLRQKKG